MFKAKLKAALIHGSITLVLALLNASIVYGLWYPGAFAEMTHGTDLFKLLLSVEVVLGPVMSLVIYNSRKPKAELFRDYCIVGVIQVAALVYGLHSVLISRPVFLVFVKDRIEVVAATELAASDIEKALTPYRSLPLTGPKLICVEGPSDAKEKSDLIESAFKGKDIQLIPKYYRECRESEIASKAYTKEQLASLTHIKVDDLPATLTYAHFTWLPVVTRFSSWAVFFKNGDTSEPVYVNVDPFDQEDVGEHAPKEQAHE